VILAQRGKRVNIVNLSMVHFLFIKLKKVVVRRNNEVYDNYEELVSESQTLRLQDVLEGEEDNSIKAAFIEKAKLKEE
jgi:hypothetical protein